MCKYDEHGVCTAPYTICPHWQGIYCGYDTAEYKVEKCVETMNEIDQYDKEHPEVLQRAAEKFADQFADVKDIALGDKWNGERRSNMDAVKFITTMARICAVDHCRDCALDFYCTKLCCERTEDDAEKAMAIVEKWLKDHPPKTRQSEFLKRYPDAIMDDKGIISIHPCTLDKVHYSIPACGCECVECYRRYWLEEVE